MHQLVQWAHLLQNLYWYSLHIFTPVLSFSACDSSRLSGFSLPFVWSMRSLSLCPSRLAFDWHTCGSGLSSRDIDLSSSYRPTVSHDPWPFGVKPAAVWMPLLHLAPISNLQMVSCADDCQCVNLWNGVDGTWSGRHSEDFLLLFCRLSIYFICCMFSASKW